MALDKQKILSDLGNVVNQLQSADCGCMGKLFSNSGQAQGTGATGCRCHNSCCYNQGGYGHQYPGASYPAQQQAMSCSPCMAMSCNPPKLYSDTYSYLNQNLMQPVIREVYEDLSSISPQNTVMNNPMGNQLGLAQGPPKTPVVRGNMGEIVGQTPMGDAMGGQNAMQSMGSMPPQNAMNPMSMGGQQQQNSMGGMGAEILKMMMSSNKSQPMNMTGQSGQQPNQGGVMNAPMGTSQHGSNVGGTGPNTVQYSSAEYNSIGGNQGEYNTGNMQANQMQYSTEMARSQNGAVPQMQNPTAQYMTQPNMYAGGSSPVNTVPNMAGNTNMNEQMGYKNANNLGGQQMPATQSGNYGIHGQGMAKFNEMFPGVTQGMGGNLDFDPMSIAIQMNPANQKQATMNAIQKLMSGNSATNKPLDRNAVEMQPVMNGINAVNTNFTQNQNQAAPNTQVPPVPPNEAINQEQLVSSPASVTGQPHQMQPQVVYATGIDELAKQEELQQQKSPGLVGIPDGGYPNQLPASARQQIIREPLYPVDTTRFSSSTLGHKYEYNTLGQPIEPLPVKSYRHTEPSLPQTLSPQPVPQKLRNPVQPKYVVKNTVSKTSIFGNKTVGKTPSRRELQQVYNTYKGSVSNTKQNARPPQQLSASDGRLNANQYLAPVRQVPVERVGGDTIANNQVINNQVSNKGDHYNNEVLEAVANQPHGDGRPEKPVAPSKIVKGRNGLQDLVFTSYPHSSAWSFHGNNYRQAF